MSMADSAIARWLLPTARQVARGAAALLVTAGAPVLLWGPADAQGPPFQPPMQPPMGPFGGRGWGPSGSSGTGDWLGWLVTLLVVALVAAAIIYLVQRIVQTQRTTVGSPRGGRAREVLEERYARGEIDRMEFEEKRRDLG